MSFQKILAAGVACVMCAGVCALPGCSSLSATGSSSAGSSSSAVSSSDSSTTLTSREYMSTMNQKAEDLSTRLDSFVDAVSREDLVSMKIQAESAYEVLDQMINLEAPSDLSEVKDNYDNGIVKLKEALSNYINIYSELESSDLDKSAYDEQIAAVQTLYTEGIDAIKQADQKAQELN